MMADGARHTAGRLFINSALGGSTGETDRLRSAVLFLVVTPTGAGAALRVTSPPRRGRSRSLVTRAGALISI